MKYRKLILGLNNKHLDSLLFREAFYRRFSGNGF